MPGIKSSQNRKLATIVRAQLGLITLEQAARAGLTPRQCHQQVADGRWEQVARGLYRLNGAPDSWEHRVWAACLEAKGWASHRTAAWLHGLDGVGRWPPRELEVIVGYESNRKSKRAKVRRSRTLVPTHLSKAAGVPKTNLPRTLIDLSEVLDDEHLEQAFDSALRKVSDIRHWLRRLLNAMPNSGHRGIARLTDLLDDRRRAVDSALEVKVLRLLKQSRVPEPITNFIGGGDGMHIAQIDFAWPHNRPRVALMAHGERFHMETRRWLRDLKSGSRLSALGWRVLQVSYDQLINEPEQIVLDVRRALAGYVSPQDDD